MPSELSDPLSQLLVQLVTVLLVAQTAGRVCVRLGQPAVIGEMAAGICLGPSLLGWIAPGLFAALFPASSLATLQLLSQIGVCLFLFVVGMSVDIGHVRRHAPAAVLISHASIVVPALMGGVMAFALGALMNTRGLMELIALNIGYDLGILSPEIFAMLVIMALVTTALTGPLLTLANRWRPRQLA